MPFGDEGAAVSSGDLPPGHQDAPPDVVASARARARALVEALDLRTKEGLRDPKLEEQAFRQIFKELLDEAFEARDQAYVREMREQAFRQQRRGEREDIDIPITPNPDAAKAFQLQRAGERAAGVAVTPTITNPDAAKAFQAQRAGERAPVGQPAVAPPDDDDVGEPGPIGEGEI